MLNNTMNKLKATWKDLDKTISVNKRELVLGIAACTLAGAVVGLLLSPRKTVSIYNGGHHTHSDPAPTEEEESAEEA